MNSTIKISKKFKWTHILLWISVILWLIPVIWMISLSLQPNNLLARTTSNTFLGLVPKPFSMENFIKLFSFGLVKRWLLNSVVITFFMIASVLVTSTLAGYALSKINFIGKKIILPLIIASLTIPEQSIIIPLYTMFSNWNWYSHSVTTYIALIIPRLASPFGVFFMMQFFRGIPSSIEEAAQIDGASRWKIFLKVILPLSTPAITSLAILTFLYSWNDFLWPLISISKKEWLTVTTGLASIQSNFAQSEGLGSIMASGVVTAIPVILLLIFLQKYIIRGVALSGGK